MSKDIIEFDESNQPAPETDENETAVKVEKKLSDYDARFSKIESALTKISKSIEALQSAEDDEEDEDVDEESDEELKSALKSLTDGMEKLSKKVSELESIPQRLTSNVENQSKVDDKVKEFLSKVTGGEVLVYAEKNNIAWGNKRFPGD